LGVYLKQNLPQKPAGNDSVKSFSESSVFRVPSLSQFEDPPVGPSTFPTPPPVVPQTTPNPTPKPTPNPTPVVNYPTPVVTQPQYPSKPPPGVPQTNPSAKPTPVVNNPAQGVPRANNPPPIQNFPRAAPPVHQPAVPTYEVNPIMSDSEMDRLERELLDSLAPSALDSPIDPLPTQSNNKPIEGNYI